MISDLAGFEEPIAAQHLLGRIAQPEEIADAVLYLLWIRVKLCNRLQSCD